MKFLANENVPLAAVYHLRNCGHDVLTISEDCPGSTDQAVLSLACEHKRALIDYV